MTATTRIDARRIGDSVGAMRDRSPLVQCLTNVVVTNWTANVLLAAGAAPAMVDNPHEAEQFARVADGVLVNLGTPHDDTAAAMREAVAGAAAAHTPWVLDPVAVGGLPWRTGLARELLDAHAPAIVRGNASEIAGLAGGAGGRGVDATQGPEAVLDVARELSRAHGCVVAVSGAVDHLVDGDRLVRLGNGHPWLTRVTGVGCALGALMAAFAAGTDDHLLAAAGATSLLTIAAEAAAECAHGPGSFAVGLLDRLESVTAEQVAASVCLR